MSELILFLLPVLFAAPMLVGFAYTAWHAAKDVVRWYRQPDVQHDLIRR